ncbi:Endogenous retrovirus group PABLB member 1 Env polyprotein [Merluccius polli]|uniref:Endogenous retrovirus group PABLB member 1 Env polyprotein n=1 Tax=Merluccius polli TaxID=89951 RepID=A0AA47P3M2_MERPO|nr:Endogenous retrovirus group PABLB member 1 Env polyprotein [Merluccius polli]
MAFQNRLALDMLLAEKGGVCAMFGDQCCTFIPNNTAPDGSVTKALAGLRALSNLMAEDSGVENPLEEWFTGINTVVFLAKEVLEVNIVDGSFVDGPAGCEVVAGRQKTNRVRDPRKHSVQHLGPQRRGSPWGRHDAKGKGFLWHLDHTIYNGL